MTEDRGKIGSYLACFVRPEILRDFIEHTHISRHNGKMKNLRADRNMYMQSRPKFVGYE